MRVEEKPENFGEKQEELSQPAAAEGWEVWGVDSKTSVFDTKSRCNNKGQGTREG